MIRTALSCLALVATLIPFRSHAENYLGYYTGIARAESLLVAGAYTASLSVYDSLGGSYAWNDPADCYMIATARVRRIPVITRDAVILKIAASGDVEAVAC